MNYTGAILAGGLSKRMGSPKEGVLLWDKRPMIEHVMDTLRTVCKNVVIVGKCEGYDPKNTEIIYDYMPNLGPIGGIESLLSSEIDTGYLVMACDQPLVTEELLRSLIKEGPSEKIRLFQVGEDKKINPFPGYYPASFLEHIRESIQKGKTAMHEMIESTEKITWVEIDKSELKLLRSINTKEELEKIKVTK